MPTYTAPTRDTRFVLNEMLELASYGNLPGFENATQDMIDTIVNGMFAPLESLPRVASALGMIVGQALLHVPVPSVSGMPPTSSVPSIAGSSASRA